MKITIEAEVHAPLAVVWDAWVTPDDITQWNFALDSWCCPNATIDLRVGGRFNYRMEAKDGSMGFDFEGTFTKINPRQLIEYVMDDRRTVTIDFKETNRGVRVIETFDPEDIHAAEQQRQGWQNILDQFKRHVESKLS
ncbi:MAG: SRPBCC family protein [Acidobacteria bacterium]|nr:SRPBCC family protein [Acidobacteriota bacterium]